jgi:dTDP-4-amino-4,6-dideoxygalactose transaminase
MPNLNAALGCAQLESLESYLQQKRKLAIQYQSLFQNSEYAFVKEPEYATSNYWLNAVLCADEQARNELLKVTNEAGVMTRPIWKLMPRLPMYAACKRGDLSVSEKLEATLVNLPSMPPVI